MDSRIRKIEIWNKPNDREKHTVIFFANHSIVCSCSAEYPNAPNLREQEKKLT